MKQTVKELSIEELLSFETAINKVELTDQSGEVIGAIYVKEFTSRDRKILSKIVNSDETRIPAAYIICGICDKDGNKKFQENESTTVDDMVEKILTMPDKIVGQLLAAVMSINKNDERQTAKN